MDFRVSLNIHMRPLLLLSLLCGAAYLATVPWHPFPGSIALKGLSVGLLAVWTLTEMHGANRLWLTAALALGSLGDVLLDLPGDNFVFGLGSFLLGHVCYIRLFLLNREKGSKLSGARTVLVAAVVLFTAGFTLWLMPVLKPDLGLPVMFYVGALSAMTISAIALNASTNWIQVGAILFLLSDTILGANKFRGKVPYSGWLIWSTYYVGQTLIASGCMRVLSRK